MQIGAKPAETSDERWMPRLLQAIAVWLGLLLSACASPSTGADHYVVLESTRFT